MRGKMEKRGGHNRPVTLVPSELPLYWGDLRGSLVPTEPQESVLCLGFALVDGRGGGGGRAEIPGAPVAEVGTRMSGGGRSRRREEAGSPQGQALPPTGANHSP